MAVFDWDDFGANHVISDQCQSHDCRDQLDKLHILRPEFKCTLFAIPAEMTMELAEWCNKNSSWVELAWHGFFHDSNYECADMTYQEFDSKMTGFGLIYSSYFVNGFKAPGWQISDDCYRWLADHDWWVADQWYNIVRRANISKKLKAYVHNDSGNFVAWNGNQDTDLYGCWHGHTYDCMGNGIYETFDHVSELVKKAGSFQFISEVL